SRSSIGFSNGSGTYHFRLARQGTAGEGTQDRGEAQFERLARNHVVDHPLVQEELRSLEALGEVLFDGLLDHTRPGERDEGARLGEDDVAKGREAGRYA